ncbi:hypothetical protein [Halotalea alkalilenta]|uniref:hypothetical protein n=1 Tax=Halotalea alkalilenta TaxID=376489 RepID=UPI001FE0AAB2|nr:hypothetical protein [Halotalea alkalilenta]
MYTIIETATFRRYATGIWQEDERLAFFSWLAANSLTGDVIPATSGLRKIRWSRSGMGKPGDLLQHPG